MSISRGRRSDFGRKLPWSERSWPLNLNATRTATTADLLAGFRAEPLEGLPGPCGDALEVVIAMELGKPLQLSGRGDDQVDSSGTSVFPEIDVAVAARYYPSLYVHLLHS